MKLFDLEVNSCVSRLYPSKTDETRMKYLNVACQIVLTTDQNAEAAEDVDNLGEIDDSRSPPDSITAA
jgi:hypothetical protein